MALQAQAPISRQTGTRTERKLRLFKIEILEEEEHDFSEDSFTEEPQGGEIPNDQTQTSVVLRETDESRDLTVDFKLQTQFGKQKREEANRFSLDLPMDQSLEEGQQIIFASRPGRAS